MVDWDDNTKTSIPVAAAPTPTTQRDRAYLIVLAGNSVGEMYKVTEALVLGRGQETDIRIVDEGISRRHARIVSSAGQSFVEDLGSTNGTYLNGQKVTRQVLKDGDKIQVGSTTILKFTYHDHLDENFQRQMYESALRDGLTKAFNKKYFIDRLESEFSFAARHQTPLSLVMFDLDHFKAINDQHGHLAGDYVLSALGDDINAKIRDEDVFARYGGEEFAIICRGIPPSAAQTFAERVRRAVEEYPFKYETNPLKVTASVGVASLPDASIRDAIAFIAAADQALYEAKNAGRNRVVFRKPR